MGFWSYGAFLETARVDRGLNGPILLNGENILGNTWLHRPGLKGEILELFNPNPPVVWNDGIALNRPMTWYEIEMTMPAPAEEHAYALLMTSLGKGNVWVNGNYLGRFWNIVGEGNCAPCDYRENYGHTSCQTRCGDPTQSLYHLPRDWMMPGGGVNRVVVFTEIGGNAEDIQLVEIDETPSPF
eukprot:TRINITY_DN3262_c0_g1_i1.p1 TRINITY_DN3262_c0_g1~~TRINITY_DN3262_c0_g1_i1.p1  ORF type:complete len:184 (-),score=21.30 TRINITY_DN3262_c0_g1_i1:90-641(-)